MKCRTYNFVDCDGAVIRRAFWDNEVPQAITHAGRDYLLDLEETRHSRAPTGIVKEYRHVAYQLPRLWQQPELAQIWDKFSPQGHILCEGKRDVQELEARLADRGGYVSGYRYGTGD